MESVYLTRPCLSDLAHQLDTPITFVAPFFSVYFLRDSISDRKTCDIHACLSLEPSIMDMAVDKRGILDMLYITVDLFAGRRLEGFRGNTRAPQSFRMVPEGSRII